MALTVLVQSFSYKKGGIPTDDTGNGGGFCFDCRGILNPGRIDEYKIQTGRDEAVQAYLENNTEMTRFLNLAQEMVSMSVRDYLERGFENLQVNFGCTGGQHRSVYGADKMGKFLREKFPQVKVIVRHNEQPNLNTDEQP